MLKGFSRAIHAGAIASIATIVSSSVLGVQATTTQTTQATSTLIKNARIIDGSGAPARRGDVRFVGDKIAAVGMLTATPADHVIDAHGLALAPGFIDTHSHHDKGMFQASDDGDDGAPTGADNDTRAALPLVSQGVTTIIVGQDGSSTDLAGLFKAMEATPAAVNIGSYVGHGTVRARVMGADFKRAATPEELEKMKTLIRKDMAAGALGLSTGLEYDPGIAAPPEEVLALAKVAGDMGGRYISHMRSESRAFWPALSELLNIGRVDRMPVQVSHIKLGMAALWGQADSVLRTLDRARAAGIKVTADVYPYTSWQSSFKILFPKRNFADSTEAAFALENVVHPDGLIINNFPGHTDYAGKTLAEVARMRGTTPVRTLLDLMAEPGGPTAGIIGKGMDEKDVETFLKWPYANISSDGMNWGFHPRGYGSFARVLGPMVRDKKLFTVEEAVRKMSSLAAANVGLTQRGSIKPGYYADLVLFDPAKVQDKADFGPEGAAQQVAVGIETVWVNGRTVWDGGKVTGAYPGRGLKRATTPTTR